MADPRPARTPDDVTWPEVVAALEQLAALVDARLPERFYAREPPWRSAATVLAARMAQIARAIGTLIGAEHFTEAIVLFRGLYEHMVVLGWILAAPETRAAVWLASGHKRRRVIHFEAVKYGVTVMTDEELAETADARALPPLPQMAQAIDAFWPSRITGFRSRLDERAPVNILTIAGLYTGLYRGASPRAHGEVTGTDGVAGADLRGRLVVRFGEDPMADLLPMAVPVFAMGLMTVNYRLGWPDDDTVRRINDDLLRE